MSDFEKKIRDRLDTYRKQLFLSQLAHNKENELLIRVQVAAYRCGLEDCLSPGYVTRLFKGYELFD